MATAVTLKRKNIDLPVDILQTLSLLAVSQGKSLKNYIETILIAKAQSVTIQITENPSPSGDEWFNNPENSAMVQRGIEDMKAGRTQAYTLAELKQQLGV